MPRFCSIVVEVGGVERALARLVDHGLAGERIELGNDVVAGLAADQDAPHRAGIADAQATARRARPWPAARRTDRADGLRGCGRPACRRRAPRPAPPRSASPRARAGETSLPSVSPKPPGSRKSRCMSMMTKRGRRPVERDRLRLRGDRACSGPFEFAMTYAPRTRELLGASKQGACHCVQCRSRAAKPKSIVLSIR